MKTQRCYNGVRLLGDGPSLENVRILDHGAIPMIAYMAEVGLQVDLSHFERMAKTLTEDMDRITEEVHTLTGHRINLDSGPQVADLLFKKLGLKQARPKLTKSKDRESVENEVLVAIQHDHEVVPLLLDYKELSKLRGTYVLPIPRLAKRVGPGHYRLFPNWKHTRVPSGRLAASDPNLLAMPSRTARGRQIREGFITRPGWTYVSVDESQIEVRITAHNSNDANLIRVYENEEDIYSDFATTAFRLEDKRYRDETGWHYPTVHKQNQRFPAKTCVLASIYDVTAKGLLEQMPIVCGRCGVSGSQHRMFNDEGQLVCPRFEALWTENKCQDLINSFYLRYRGVLDERKRNHARARKFGYVWDIWGRILHVQAVKSSLEWVVSAALRELGNFPAQSSAQGTIKLVMAEVMDALTAWGVLGEYVNPLLQIHDELLFEVREDWADDLIAYVSDCFERCVRLRVPIKAGGAKAPTWGALEK